MNQYMVNSYYLWRVFINESLFLKYSWPEFLEKNGLKEQGGKVTIINKAKYIISVLKYGP